MTWIPSIKVLSVGGCSTSWLFIRFCFFGLCLRRIVTYLWIFKRIYVAKSCGGDEEVGHGVSIVVDISNLKPL